MSGGSIAALAGVVNLCSLSASLTKTAAPSGGIVASDTATVRVPVGNSGTLNFNSFVISGTITTEYRKNGGSWTSISEGTGVTFANGDTLEARGRGMTAGESWAFTLQDNTKLTNLATYTITAS